jgi:hypothetical protein
MSDARASPAVELQVAVRNTTAAAAARYGSMTAVLHMGKEMVRLRWCIQAEG